MTVSHHVFKRNKFQRNLSMSPPTCGNWCCSKYRQFFLLCNGCLRLGKGLHDSELGWLSFILIQVPFFLPISSSGNGSMYPVFVPHCILGSVAWNCRAHSLRLLEFQRHSAWILDFWVSIGLRADFWNYCAWNEHILYGQGASLLEKQGQKTEESLCLDSPTEISVKSSRS